MFYTFTGFGSASGLCRRCKITTSLNLGFFTQNEGLVLPRCPEQRSNERTWPRAFSRRSAQSRGSRFCFLSLSPGRWLPPLQSRFSTPSSFLQITVHPAISMPLELCFLQLGLPFHIFLFFCIPSYIACVPSILRGAYLISPLYK